MRTPTGRELRGLAGVILPVLVVVALFGSLATACTPRPEPSAEAEASESIVLSPAAPVAARRFDWSLTLPDGATPRGVVFDVAVSVAGMPAPGVELVAVPRDGDGNRHEPDHAWAVSGGPVGACGGGCAGGLDLVIRARPEAFSGSGPLEVRLGARLHAALVSDADAEAARASTLLGASSLLVQAPTSASADVHGSRHLRAGDPEVTVPLRLRVEAAATGGERAWPLSGRLHVEVRVTGASDPEATGAIARVVVAGSEAWLQDDTIAVDWLASCPSAGACDLPVRLVLALAPGWDTAADGPPPEVDVTWSVAARLEAYDGRALPVSALRLEEAP